MRSGRLNSCSEPQRLLFHRLGLLQGFGMSHLPAASQVNLARLAAWFGLYQNLEAQTIRKHRLFQCFIGNLIYLVLFWTIYIYSGDFSEGFNVETLKIASQIRFSISIFPFKFLLLYSK